jgi:hypothetical protein
MLAILGGSSGGLDGAFSGAPEGVPRDDEGGAEEWAAEAGAPEAVFTETEGAPDAVFTEADGAPDPDLGDTDGCLSASTVPPSPAACTAGRSEPVPLGGGSSIVLPR